MPDPSGIPLRWKAAGQLARRLPQIPGRTRLVEAVRGPRAVDAIVDVAFGPGLVFTADCSHSGNVFFFQYAEPALAPLLDAVLRPGDTFVDVGANIGTYACWAAHRVGPTGKVIAFEPVAPTRADLDRNVARNGLGSTVEVVAAAAGDTTGTTSVWLVPGGHGLASVAHAYGAVEHQVPLTTVDEAVGPGLVRLVKIDVEGYEAAVVRGMARVLDRDTPVVVVEVIPAHLARLGASPDQVLGPLARRGYGLYDLTPRGIRPAGRQRPSANVVALHPTVHADEIRVLSRTRFARDQTD